MSRHIPTIHGLVEPTEDDDNYMDYLDGLAGELPSGDSYGLLLFKANPIGFYAGRDEWLRENSSEESGLTLCNTTGRIKAMKIKTGMFQTGRMYSKFGQRILWATDGDAVYFKDVDRGIEYGFTTDGGTEIAKEIMKKYDHNECHAGIHEQPFAGLREVVRERYPTLPPVLVNKESGRLVEAGDVVYLGGGIEVTVTHFRPPHKSSSEGKVSVRDAEGRDREFYVSVIGAEWIGRADR